MGGAADDAQVGTPSDVGILAVHEILWGEGRSREGHGGLLRCGVQLRCRMLLMRQVAPVSVRVNTKVLRMRSGTARR